jgi:hypothetical protein
MSQPSSSFSFQVLFNIALQDYESQTGTRLVDHPLAKELESCNSVDSINAILQEQAQIFREFRGDSGKLMKSLKCSVDILYTLSVSTLLGEGVSLVCTKHLLKFIVLDSYSTVIPTFESNIRCNRHPIRRMSLSFKFSDPICIPP